MSGLVLSVKYNSNPITPWYYLIVSLVARPLLGTNLYPTLESIGV